MKLTKLRATLFALTLPILLFINGCATPTVNVQDQPIARAALNLQDPASVNLDVPSWTVITQNNYEEVFKQMKAKDPNSVLLAVDPKGFEDLTTNDYKLEQFILLQKGVTQKYRDYYEAPPTADKDPDKTK